MIEVSGVEGTSEYRAALAIKNAFESYWPGIASTPAEDELVRISTNTKLSNYKVSDIDIVIAAQMGPSRYIIPKTVLKDKSGKKLLGAKIRVRSLIAAIEVKDHDAEGLQINASGVNVRYKEGWKSATDQNDAQKYALLNYFRDVSGKDPWLYRCVMLQGINELPKDRGRQLPAAATVAASFDTSNLLSAMAAENSVPKIASEYSISSGDRELVQCVLAAPLFVRITPSRLDRKRMDRIAARPLEARKLAELLGDERVHLRGEGGTGKTVLLAQTAYEAFKSHGKRSLLLTYNHALAADIQRLLALLNIPCNSETGGVDVRTIMSFTYAWLAKLGAIKDEKGLDFDRYTEKCVEILGYFESGLLEDEDIRKAKQEFSEQFDYDAVLMDEAQDWPQPEADLLIRLYGGEKISLADGVSQLIRGRPTDWRSSVLGRSIEGHIPLNECLRMKANLGVFANAVAERAGLNWEITPNTKAAGGRVILSYGSFAEKAELHENLISLAEKAGNEPVDFLYCVPASAVRMLGNKKASILGSVFENTGKQVWDGVDPIARRDYPRSTKDFRIVQYDSCRGLEGWVTVLDGFDEFWSLKYEESLSNASSQSEMEGKEKIAKRAAWTWAMIALTRPIDTIVITLKDPDSEVSRILHSIAEFMPDVVEVS